MTNQSNPVQPGALPVIDTEKLPALMRRREVQSRVLQISVNKLRSLVSSGELETVTIDGQRLFVTASLAAWIERKRVSTKVPVSPYRRIRRKSTGSKPETTTEAVSA